MTGGACSIEGCDRAPYARSWCKKHYTRWRRNGDPAVTREPRDGRTYSTTPEDQRFWAKVEKTSSCWLWRGGISNTGYGLFTPTGGRTTGAHRWAFGQTSGPIEPGLQLDHLCRNRVCVNPAHLEPVTQRINILRGTSPGATAVRTNRCKRDHEFTPENTYVRPDGQGRQCLECCRIRARKSRSAA